MKVACFFKLNSSVVITFCMACVLNVTAQTSQTIKGIITDKASEKPLPHVTVGLSGTNISAKTDSLGRYFLSNIPVGRQKVSFSSVGYKPVTIPEVLVTSGKEVVLDVALEQDIFALTGVTITGSKVRKGVANNEFAGSSSRSFSMSEVTRYSGGRNDPAKLVSNFAGVATTNDSRNDIVVRGNSPSALLWRLEGIPIPNPNHFAALGTTGGPVSAVNTNALKNSDFYTSAFPAEYGNAVGAVFDLGLRNGNADKFERTVQLNLFSGLEAMIEGPVGKKKNGSSFLFGYRYSFAQIGQSLGFNIGSNAVPKYQDMVLNVSFAKSKVGTFNIFGMGGISNIDLIGAELDSTDLFANKNEDTYFSSSFGVGGVKHTIDLGKKSYLRSVLSYSYTANDGELYKYYETLPERRFELEQSTSNGGLRLSSYFNSKISRRLSIRSGFTFEQTTLNTSLYTRENRSDWEYIRNYDGSSSLIQPYVQAKYRFSEKLSSAAGLHAVFYSFNNTRNVEPRFNVNYAFNNQHTLSAGYGLHSQLQPLPVYLYQAKLANGSYDESNRDLDLTKAHHFIIGYEWRFLPDWRFKSEAYYQYLFDVPIERNLSGFSILNTGADFSFPEKGFLVNEGSGTNAGVELTLEKFFSKGMYLLATASIFDSKYKGSDGIERNSAFNNKTVFNVLAGREFKTGRTKQNTFSIDFKLSSSGGRYYTPVDINRSIAANTEILDESSYNSNRLSGYFRFDTRLGLQLNSSNRKLSQAIYLDFQNVTNNENIFVQRYNVVRKQVGTVNQIGFFPDILYKLQF